MISNLMLDLLNVDFHAVLQEKVGINKSIAHRDDGTEGEEENESHELVGS